MIVVEGPDGAGKSTLVSELCARLNLLPGKRSIVDRDLLYQTTVPDSYSAVEVAVRGANPPRVWDRMFYSDPIYANIVRDEESRFTDAQFNHLHSLVLALRVPVVLCLPPLEVVRANVTAGHQLDGVVEHIDQIYQGYRDLADVIPPRQLIVYDYTIRGTLPRVCNRLREYLRYREDRTP